MRKWLSGCTAVVIAMALVGVGAQPAAAGDDSHGQGGHQQERQYLALGDSLPFGFNPTVAPVAANYTGYPEKAAPGLSLALTNASCPGQSSAGFVSLKGLDNGCFDFREKYPDAMHTAYAGTQLDYSVAFLRSHPKTRLVTITLGANDLFICAAASTDRCASRLPVVLQKYEKNLKKILKSIRRVYHGKLVAVTYYSTDYRDPVVTGSVAAINQVASRVVSKFWGTTADGFAAFAAVAAANGGDTCAAGLLIPLGPGKCDIHPSEKGAKLLADTLTAVVNCDAGYRYIRDREDALVSANG